MGAASAGKRQAGVTARSGVTEAVRHNSSKDGWLFAALFGLSLVGHVGAGAGLIYVMPRKEGAISLPTEAISISLEASDVIDAVNEADGEQGGNAHQAGETAEKTPEPDVPEPEEVEEPKPEEPKPEEAKVAEPKPEEPAPEPEIAEQAPPEKTLPEEPAPEPKVAQREPPPEELKPEARQPEQPTPEAPKPEDIREAEDAQEIERQRLAEEALRKAEDDARQEAEAERQRLAEQETRRKAEEAERHRVEEARRREDDRRREQERRLAEDRRREEAERARKETALRQEREKKREEEARKRRAKVEGGVVGKAGGEGSEGRVSASQGALMAYKAAVTACLHRNKPSGGPAGRKVRIEFTMSASGRPTAVVVTGPSGDSSADSRSRGAVSSSSCQAPPPGTKPGQLRYSIVYSYN